MALLSLMMQPSWQTYIDDLATLFIQKQTPQALESWKESGFTNRIKSFIEQDVLPKDSSWVNEAVSRSACLAQKCRKTAEEYRQEGNKKFQRKQYKQAVDEYTQCIRYAPDDAVSLGYANRSAALFHSGEYRHCILDVKRALGHEYPSRLRHKLYYRRALSYKILAYNAAARKDLLLAVESLQDSDLDKARKDQLLKEMETDLQKLKCQNEGSTEPAIDPYPRLSIPDVTGGCHRQIPQASARVSLKYALEQGRHLVASEDLKPGDALIVERPYAAVLLPDYYTSHCHHCITKTTAPIPCRCCPIALYCSPECREASWKAYHKIECPYLGIMHSIGIAHLAFRIVIISGLKNLLEFRESEKLDASSPATEAVDDVYEFGYRSVYNLLHHTDRIQTEDLVQYTLGAVFLLRLLTRVGFFSPDKPTGSAENVDSNPNPNKNVDDDEKNVVCCETGVDHLYVGGLLLRHLQQLIGNAHAISDLAVSGGGEENGFVCDMSDVRLATAIYPTASMMNHSCDPNILSNFQNETLIVRCTKSIKKGEQIYNCYGPHCKRMVRRERQSALRQQYFFTCQCSACGCGDQARKLEKHKAFKCPHCEGPLPKPKIEEGKVHVICVDCGTDTSKEVATNLLPLVNDSQKFMMAGLLAADKGDFKAAKENLRLCLRLQKQVLYKEHEDMAATSDQLARIYSLEENYAKAEPYVVYSVKVIGRIHGYQSVEYGLEVKKLAQIQFNALMVDKCRLTVDRALEILGPSLGQGNDMVLELVKMKNCLRGQSSAL